jgi:hypothetical protein
MTPDFDEFMEFSNGLYLFTRCFCFHDSFDHLIVIDGKKISTAMLKSPPPPIHLTGVPEWTVIAVISEMVGHLDISAHIIDIERVSVAATPWACVRGGGGGGVRSVWM